MKLKEMTLEAYLELLSSGAPAPGGGSAAALSGAQGAALTAMVCNLTLGREKYAQYEELIQKALGESCRLTQALTAQIDADTAAYTLVSGAYRLPKETPQEKAARSRSIAAATEEATRVPLETMRLGLQALQTTAGLVGRSNRNAASDLAVAALNLSACVEGAFDNVRINLPGLGDEETRESFQHAASAISTEAKALTASICQGVREG